MAEYSIIVDDDLDKILGEICVKSNLTKRQYATNIVHNFLEAQFRGKIKADIDNKPFNEIKRYDTALLIKRSLTKE